MISIYLLNPSTIIAAVSQCSDGIDNDLDGYSDFPHDPGCSNADDPEEFDSPPPPPGPIKAGGLLWYPVRAEGPNLITNGGFEDVDSTTNEPFFWQSNGFEADPTVAHTGLASYRITDAHLIPYAQSAYQTLEVKKGVYRLQGWVKLQDMAGNGARGVRICFSAPAGWPHSLGRGCTAEVKGTGDWQFLEREYIAITEDATAKTALETVSEPDGTAWFDDVEIHEMLPHPIEVFLLFPNYRGMLFDDQTQKMRFDVTVNPRSGILDDYEIDITVTDELDGLEVLQQSFPADVGTAEMDASALVNGRTYLTRCHLVRKADNHRLYEYPAYRISKLSGSLRTTMTMSYDEHNRFLVRGEPTFILGVYDSGMGYTTSESSWEKNLQQNRRLFELPINFYLNYWYGKASIDAMTAMMNVLQRHDILYLQTGNCFNTGYNRDFLIHTDDDYTLALGDHPGLAGFYTMDECAGGLAPLVFEDYLRLRDLDADGVTFGASNKGKEIFLWRDTLDFLSMDPYPLYGEEPQEGYPLHLVSQDTAAIREALKNSRPYGTVIQFFKFTSKGRWPTRKELHDMSYMAIAEGANGLFYWSLGVNALAYTCIPSTEWCSEKVEHFEDLKATMNELQGIKSALASVDRPELLAANSNSAIHTRVKITDTTAWLIAANVENNGVTSSFALSRKPQEVIVYNEDRTLAFADNSFTDSFAPYEAHVYEIPLVTELLGDLDVDNDCDGYDLKLFSDAFTNAMTTADLNEDGHIDADDVKVFADNFGKVIEF